MTLHKYYISLWDCSEHPQTYIDKTVTEDNSKAKVVEYDPRPLGDCWFFYTDKKLEGHLGVIKYRGVEEVKG